MIFVLLFASLVSTHTLYATDDVWIYPHSFDQTGDPVLRIWGDGTNSVGDPGSSQHSYSIVRFDLSTVSESAPKLKKATLVLFHEVDAGFSANDTKIAPLEARIVDANFDEKKWTFEEYSRHFPKADETSLLGKASPVPTQDGKPFKIEVDLLTGKGDFRKQIEGKKAVAIALTTKMTPGGAEGPYYKVLSRSNDKALQPRLVLEYGD
jgi:hypothetical protein